MKIIFGTRWSVDNYTTFIENILIHLYKSNKKTKEWFKDQHQSGSDGSYNIKSALVERRELRGLINLEEEKYINNLLSNKWDRVEEYEKDKEKDIV